MWSACSCMWRVCVAVDNPAGVSFASLPARPAEALMWQRQSLWSAGLTLWCCGRDAEPVSTNPISITLAASYLWLRWPSALPPSRKSSPLSCTLAVSLSPSFSLMSLYHPAPFLFPVLYPSFHFFRLFSLPPSILIGIPWQSFWCNIGSIPRKEDARNEIAYKKIAALWAILGWKCTNCGGCKTCEPFDSCLGAQMR